MKKEETFEKALLRLEEISAQLEEEGVNLNEALNLYSEGASLIKRLNGMIEEAEKKINDIDMHESEEPDNA